MRLDRRGWIVLLASVAMALVTARLGLWQLDRAAQKNALQASLGAQLARAPLGLEELPRDAAAAASERHRAVRLRGRWLAEHTVYLDNRQMNGRPGFYALTPLLLPEGRGTVLVQRGWLPRDLLDRTRIVAPPPPAGEVAVLGRIALAPARLYEFEAAASGPIRQNLDLDAFARERRLALLPWLVVQEDGPPGAAPVAAAGSAAGADRAAVQSLPAATSAASAAAGDGLLRQWPQPAADVHKHYGYAFQWFALCALIIALYVWFQLIRPRRAPRAEP